MRKSDKVWSLPLGGGALGVFAALILAAPVAQADPGAPAPPPPPLPGEQFISTQAAAGDPALPAAVDPALPAAPPAEVPHLLSPENLPPGTSDVPTDPPQGRGTSYLRDLWHAVQTQDISGKDALLLLTQRPLDANAMPTNGLPAGPQAPLPDSPPPDAPAPDPLAPIAPPPDAPPPGPVLPGLAPPPTP
ncbi:hypothetical protein [Mycolicibacterium stellerae]|uniref:hypothetical protein n=1 Tax=Mycolicibacterium stellerae TaxID=2358193 RepID=UPI000F0AFFE0|nr:hypothetical protein [Mycolicibacterium stellerae]